MSSDHATEPTVTELIGLVRAWRGNEAASVPCPVCGAALEIADRSARPYREWYAICCSGCGLSRTVTVPLAAPIPGES